MKVSPDDAELSLDGNHGVKEKESVWGILLTAMFLQLKWKLMRLKRG